VTGLELSLVFSFRRPRLAKISGALDDDLGQRALREHLDHSSSTVRINRNFNGSVLSCRNAQAIYPQLDLERDQGTKNRFQ
jgi:hypothetical protein